MVTAYVMAPAARFDATRAADQTFSDFGIRSSALS